MRLGLASLLVALLLFSPSQSTSSTSPLSLEDDANARILALHAAPSRPSSTTSNTYLNEPFKKYASSEEDLQHNDLDLGHEDDSHKYTPATAYTLVDKRENLTSENLKSQPLYKKKQITVGYLTAVKGELRERQGLAVSGAITMALNEVNFGFLRTEEEN